MRPDATPHNPRRFYHVRPPPGPLCMGHAPLHEPPRLSHVASRSCTGSGPVRCSPHPCHGPALTLRPAGTVALHEIRLYATSRPHVTPRNPRRFYHVWPPPGPLCMGHAPLHEPPQLSLIHIHTPFAPRRATALVGATLHILRCAPGSPTAAGCRAIPHEPAILNLE